jgi:CheY-like chemotaxis protein
MGYKGLIIGVTGNTMDSDIAEFENNGADLVLPKPIKPELLNKLLDYCQHYGCHSHHCYEIPEVSSFRECSCI